MATHGTRRTFLKLAAVGAILPLKTIRGAFDGNVTNARPTLIDSHTHFYDPTRAEGVPWPPKSDKLLYRPVYPEDYRRVPKPSPVAGTVVVEASPWIEDNQWVLDLAARDRFIVSFVGNLPAGTAEFRSHLTRFAKNSLFRGIRLSGNLLQTKIADPLFLADMELLAKNDLSLDVLGGFGVLPAVGQLAVRIPTLRLIIDHVAGAKIDGKPVDDRWLRAMQAVANSPNAYCKVSGLVEGTGRGDGTAPKNLRFYKPVLDAVVGSFGQDRVIYGSNWPVSGRFAELATVQAIVTDYFSAVGQTALDKVFCKNAQKFYKVSLRTA